MNGEIICADCNESDENCICPGNKEEEFIDLVLRAFKENEELSREDARKASPAERAAYAKGWKEDPAFDSFGLIPDQFCCRGECCGLGSWCCARAGNHTHDEPGFR